MSISIIRNREYVELYAIKIEYFKLLYSTISFTQHFIRGGKLT